ncbi:MAG: cupin domain-containing protein [Acidobacteriota bacterium]|nr:cupin domain-containing protein [Acidobacteriota bacterium]
MSHVSVPIGSGQTDTFAWLIDPISPAAFERTFYEQRLCLVTRTEPGYYEQLLSGRDLDTVLGSHRLSYPEMNVVKGDDDVPTASFTQGSGRINPVEVSKRFDEGATIIFTQLHRRVPALARLCGALGVVFGSRIQTNIYLTPPRAQGFKPHWDTHDVFVLQVSGRKRWSIYDTKIPLPLKGQKFKTDRDTPGPVTEEFELGAGSVVYLPRGLMHSARSTDDTSLHITLGITAFTWADFFVESVAAAALEEPRLRESLPIGYTGEGFPADEKMRIFREKLSVLQSRLEPAPVWQHFEDEVRASNSPMFTNLLAPRLRAVPTTLDTVVSRRADVSVSLEDGGAICAVQFRDQKMTLPGRVFPAVEFAMTTELFRVRDLPECLDEQGKITLVERLVKEGVLESGGAPREEERS